MATRKGEADDLAQLSKLDEATLLEELRFRYSQDKIYTYVGDIVVAVNPFKSIPIYGKEQLQKYRNAQRTQNPPHVYAISDSAFQQMMATSRNQCIVISGESGAGKTESCKFIVAELIELSHGMSVLEQKILQVNPLLEAFGNAMTVMNDNSSRFGKYLQIKFKNGHVTGAKINEYLLEKSRVVYQNEGEQNFHIFYCMLGGLDAERKAALRLTDPNGFNYLCEGAACLRSHARQKQQQFEEMQNALDLVGFESEFQSHIFTCLSAVLHMGNIQFSQDDNEYSHVVNPDNGPIRTVSELVGLDPRMLVDTVTVSVAVTRGETIRKHLNKEKANAARDALAKALYDRVFRWIVNRINQLLAPTAEEMVGENEIGILDIFGFEKFTHNSFEQLCINLANEQLQFFFNEHIFTLERQEYEREGINHTEISFQDNKPVLDMFLTRPVGLLCLLDEQSAFPKATDDNFVTKVNQAFGKLPFFIPARGSASGTFSVQHYAGKVEYESLGFLEKNRDSLPSGAVELLQTSTNDLIKLIFLAQLTRTGTLAVGRLTSRMTGRLRKRTLGREKSGGGGRGKALTVGAQFKNSLQVLIEKMNAASPHFVRCIKPNNVKGPNNFQTDYVNSQLKYTGMLETIRIRREGYAFRPPYDEFVERFKMIAASPQMTPSGANCRKILQSAKLQGFQVGRSKVFLKYWHVDALNELLDKVHQAATVLQKLVRGFVARRKFRVLLAAKREQERQVAEFLTQLPRAGDELYGRQKELNRADETRPKEELVAALTQSSTKRPEHVPPPSDANKPPPEPKLEELDEEDEEDDVFDEDGDKFVAPSRNTRFRKFGKEGTKNASVRWFKETQVGMVKNPNGLLYEWFHGIITRRQAEQRLTDKPNGAFIIRVSESRFGFSLSFRVTGRCKHYMISQLENGKYVIVGEPRVHNSLANLVQFHKRRPVNVDGDLLTLPCPQPQEESESNYGELLDDDDDLIEIEMPPVPPRNRSVSDVRSVASSSIRPRHAPQGSHAPQGIIPPPLPARNSAVGRNSPRPHSQLARSSAHPSRR